MEGHPISQRRVVILTGADLFARQTVEASTDLPVLVGFGINTPDQAQEIAGIADGCVVGSAIVKQIGAGQPVGELLAMGAALAAGAHSA